MLFRELLSIGKMDFDLIHDEYDMYDCPSFVEFDLGAFTEVGLAKFKDVLDAKVVRLNLYDGTICLSGVSVRKVEALAQAQCGYVSQTNYDKWFTQGGR